jgi:hypothetical protein
MLELLEPWCSKIWVDTDDEKVMEYKNREQQNTTYDLNKRIYPITPNIQKDDLDTDVVITFDGNRLNQESFKWIMEFPNILTDSGEVGEMGFDIFEFDIKKIKTYEQELIKCN